MSSKLKSREQVHKQSELTNKVKEMKLRQQKWMKQRDDSKNNRSEEKIQRGYDVIHNSLRNSDFDKPASDRKKKFQNWMQARDATDSTQSLRKEIHCNSSSTVSLTSGNVDSLRVPSVSSSQYGTTSSIASYDKKEDSLQQLFSPQNFDDLADKIIARVKSDLTFSPGSTESNMADSYTPKLSSKQEMSNHHCFACQTLMIMHANIPVILIPCGHTVCQACASREKVCPLCNCPITSSTANKTLQQVIIDFHSPGSGLTSPDIGTKPTYSAGKYTDHKSSSYSPHLTTDYGGTYHNLITRREILQQEASDIQANIELLKNQQTKEKQQMQNIDSQEQKILEDIKKLEEKRKSLLVNREGYEQTCQDLESQHVEESQRLLLIQKTLNSLNEELEKVQLLAGCDD